MKTLVSVENEGFESLMGKRITVYCCRYIYTGNLVGVNDEYIKLSDGGIVYDTGSHDSKEWNDYDKLPNDFYVMKGSIEFFGIFK